MLQSNSVAVYLSRTSSAKDLADIYPLERKEEILNCSSKKVIDEKYSSWKLLEKALKKQWSVELKDAQPKKTANGKWVIKGGYFSLSHSCGVVAVALSKMPVGVDIELDFLPKDNLEKRILTEKELGVFYSLKEQDKAGFLSAVWTKKESVFKMLGVGNFSPNQIEYENYFTATKKASLLGKNFYISVATEGQSEIEYFTIDCE